MCPSFFSSRKWTASIDSAYFVAIPNKAASHIQKSAPGPPSAIAVATPTIFPVPIVADNAVHSALKLESSPPSPCSDFRKIDLSANSSCENCTPRKTTVRKIPVARIKTMSGTPHTKPSMASRIELIFENILISHVGINFWLTACLKTYHSERVCAMLQGSGRLRIQSCRTETSILNAHCQAF